MSRLGTVVLACSLVQAAGAVPQTARGHITGRVTVAETGQPAAGAVVQAVTLKDGETASLKLVVVK